jgi:hypothetical protein
MAPFCIKCNKEMSCQKNGVVLHFGGGHCYIGDKFKCTVCDYEIVNGMGASYHDPDLATARAEVIPVIIESPVLIPEDDRFRHIGE